MNTQATDATTKLCIDTIRCLAMDAVEHAKSGHPGAPMALAPVAQLLYTKHLRYNPKNPLFSNRDRFVLSNGHASILLYATLHLSGYDVTLDDIKHFRSLDSRTPGHPEVHHTPGVETTTGPLGQGAANSVGMAIARHWLAAHFNRPGHDIVDYRIVAILGDGCMMEGITGEAASLAGHLQLDQLVWLYDFNHISIEGRTDLAYSDDAAKRFEAYGWFVQKIDSAEDQAELGKALDASFATRGKPSLIIVPSIIGRGAPTRQNTAKAHGEPLGEPDIRGAKEFYGWPPDAKFLVPPETRDAWTQPAIERGAKLEADWSRRFEAYAKAHPDLAEQWKVMQAGELPRDWEKALPTFPADAKGTATRVSGGKVLVAAAKKIPWLIGGSADLAPSTKTLLEETTDFSAKDRTGRNMRFGIREHAMVAACNGMALTGLRPFGASFLVFTDYARPAIRLAAMMGVPVALVFTHDSIGVGEDGPTHEPVEHLAALRAIPNLDVFRPGDANEAAMAWRHALSRKDGPTLLALSRQDLPTLDRKQFSSAEGALRGGYVLADSGKPPRLLLVGTGSELQHCVAAYETLRGEGLAVRVVSMPCLDLFERQDTAYQQQVLPSGITARVIIEAGIAQCWHKYAGPRGAIISQEVWGKSAPYNVLMEHFGFTAAHVIAAARRQLSENAS